MSFTARRTGVHLIQVYGYRETGFQQTLTPGLSGIGVAQAEDDFGTKEVAAPPITVNNEAAAQMAVPPAPIEETAVDPTPTPTGTVIAQPTFTPTATFTATPTRTPTVSPTPTSTGQPNPAPAFRVLLPLIQRGGTSGW